MGLFAKAKSATREQFGWLRSYNLSTFTDDTLAAIIVTVLVVPQSLAYALLAGLPPQVGIYASIFPLIAYALFGSSKYLQVGPTAVISLMTAVAISAFPEEFRVTAAAVLAVLTGIILVILALLRAGFIMNFVSRSVVSAYITGAAVLIVVSQIKHILGVQSDGRTVLSMLKSLWNALPDTNSVALAVGLLTILFLWMVKRFLGWWLVKMGMRAKRAKLIARIAPIIAVIAGIGVSAALRLPETAGLNVVGVIPQGIPPFAIPMESLETYQLLFVPAVVLALVAFVDSMSTAQTLAAKTRSRIDADKELLAMGASNAFAGVTGGYPVNGSMSRSAVNFSAGGKTQMVGIVTAILMVLTALFLTPLLTYLPLATLAALIIVACFSLFQFDVLWRVWVYNREDGLTALITFFAVLLIGVQWGVVAGVVLSMAFHIRSTLRPNMAIVGRFPGTEHYRDATKFNVETHSEVKTLRIDESLYYANARYLEDKIARIVRDNPDMRDLVLMCPAVNRIDASALSSLETINQRLESADIKLHFSELHSHVKERLHRSHFLDKLSGQIFLSQQEAMEALEPEPDWSQFSDHIDIH